MCNCLTLFRAKRAAITANSKLMWTKLQKRSKIRARRVELYRSRSQFGAENRYEYALSTTYNRGKINQSILCILYEYFVSTITPFTRYIYTASPWFQCSVESPITLGSRAREWRWSLHTLRYRNSHLQLSTNYTHRPYDKGVGGAIGGVDCV